MEFLKQLSIIFVIIATTKNFSSGEPLILNIFYDISYSNWHYFSALRCYTCLYSDNPLAKLRLEYDSSCGTGELKSNLLQTCKSGEQCLKFLTQGNYTFWGRHCYAVPDTHTNEFWTTTNKTKLVVADRLFPGTSTILGDYPRSISTCHCNKSKCNSSTSILASFGG